jgi:hypothetical protein
MVKGVESKRRRKQSRQTDGGKSKVEPDLEAA